MIHIFLMRGLVIHINSSILKIFNITHFTEKENEEERLGTLHETRCPARGRAGDGSQRRTPKPVLLAIRPSNLILARHEPAAAEIPFTGDSV